MDSKDERNISELKQYLLGNLPPNESEAIDLEIISQDALEEKLLWAESELMEDYIDQTLAPSEVVLFEKNFLVSDERRFQLRQISLISNYARRAADKSVSNTGCEEAPNFFTKLNRNFFLKLRPAIAVFSLVLIGLTTAIFYFMANSQTALEKEFAQINHENSGDLARFQNIYTVNLASGAFRDAGGAVKFSGDQLGDKVLFKLTLPFKAAEAETFKIELLRNQKIVFTQTNLPFYANPNGQELRLFLPSSELKKAEYQIKVFRETSDGSPSTYKFAVE